MRSGEGEGGRRREKKPLENFPFFPFSSKGANRSRKKKKEKEIRA